LVQGAGVGGVDGGEVMELAAKGRFGQGVVDDGGVELIWGLHGWEGVPPLEGS
jgi:hypothetical protein